MNLSKDHEGGSEPERTSRDRHTIKPEDGKAEKEKSKPNLSKDHDGRSDRERTSRQRGDHARGREIINQRQKLEIPFSTESKYRS